MKCNYANIATMLGVSFLLAHNAQAIPSGGLLQQAVYVGDSVASYVKKDIVDTIMYNCPNVYETSQMPTIRVKTTLPDHGLEVVQCSVRNNDVAFTFQLLHDQINHEILGINVATEHNCF